MDKNVDARSNLFAMCPAAILKSKTFYLCFFWAVFFLVVDFNAISLSNLYESRCLANPSLESTEFKKEIIEIQED